MKTGTSRTGKSISGLAYLRQRIKDVLETPKGALVGRRDFGSEIHLLQDKNLDQNFYMLAYVKLSEAINNPVNGLEDFKLESIEIDVINDRQYELTLSGQLLNNGEPITLDNIVIQR